MKGGEDVKEITKQDLLDLSIEIALDETVRWNLVEVHKRMTALSGAHVLYPLCLILTRILSDHCRAKENLWEDVVVPDLRRWVEAWPQFPSDVDGGCKTLDDFPDFDLI